MLVNSGAFAIVKLALERRTGQLVAVKIMDKRALYKHGQPNQQTDQETRILMALDHVSNESTLSRCLFTNSLL
jgi:serine/threonine protein kinase